MFFHVILTNECNMQCRYCFGEAVDDVDADFSGFEVEYSLPRKISYPMEMLKEFCEQDSEAIVTFYGGEPLLCVQEIKHIMDNVRARHFMVQTNGLLLDKLGHEYVNRLHTILVSIDGVPELTDFYRGKGTFRKVIENLRLIKRNGFRGELIARMTVMEQTDICKQVTWLLNNDQFSFPSVHWQLNAGFWQNDFPRRNFEEWAETDYNPGIRKLAKVWVDNMEGKGIVSRLYPFLGIAGSLLSKEKRSFLRCGGGWMNYAIQTDGHIVPCPTMWGMKDYYLGHVGNTSPIDLKKVFVGKPCTDCAVLDVCGGRCLYANLTKRWDSKAYSHVCNTVRNLLEAISEKMPRIGQLIDDGKIRREDFQYMKYNGCEIIP